MERKINVYFRGRKIKICAVRAGFFRRGTGLMFRAKDADSLLFDFSEDSCISLTSFFVFFPFLAIWLDENNKVLGFRIIKPFELKIKPAFDFRRIIEVPCNEENKNLIGFFVGK